MNKTNFAGLIAVLILAVLSSCSEKSGNLYDCVSADAVFVLSGSPVETFKNAGFTITSDGIEVSDAADKIMTKFTATEREAVMEFLNNSGIDFDRAVTVIDPVNSRSFMTFMLDNEDGFRDWCEKQDVKTYGSSGYSVYKNKGELSIVIKNSQAWLLVGNDHNGKEPEFIDELYSAAEKAPLPSWIKEKIDNAEALGVSLNIGKYLEYITSRSFGNLPVTLEGAMWEGYDTEAIMNGYFVYGSTFDGIAVRGKGSFYSADGEKIVNKAKIRPVNTGLLRYAREDAAVMMFSLPDSADWHQTIDELNKRLAQMGLGMDEHISTMAASVLENIDHTVMLSGRVADISALNSPKGWSGTIAIDFREGKAYEYFEMIRTMADEFGFPSSIVDGNAISFTIPQSGLSVYLKNDGNALIASLTPIEATEGNPTFVSSFDNTLGGMIIDVTKDNPLAQFVSMPFGLNLTYTATTEELTFDFSQTSAQGLMIENFLKYIADRIAD